ncbi:SEC-C domain-containing protein [Candidatus Wolfebacteria bacterium]|nr:SEC-C domain-containing protein [Candidatus Wolfebacteria bacterium]
MNQAESAKALASADGSGKKYKRCHGLNVSRFR